MIIKIKPEVNFDKILDILMREGYDVRRYGDYTYEIFTNPVENTKTKAA